MLNKFFTKAFCLNLARRADRRENCQRLFGLLEWQVEFAEAIDGGDIPARPDGGMIGAQLANNIGFARILHRAKSEGWPSVVIFEDDLLIDPNIVWKLPLYLNGLPDDWALAYLGWVPGLTHDKDEHGSYVRVNGMNGVHAVGVRQSVYKEFINDLMRLEFAADYYAAQLQKKYPCYTPVENLVAQGGWGSDVHDASRYLPETVRGNYL